ncbi:exodeoxyribonuclease VII large subunit [Thermoanaerobacter wiegelii]|uniref:Exodeoxyribonuclease 7 large subunit n=1 Tax=Thermoanaerobacter wiegelii Rt8.B1 TaxID=697303 RepID=G2MVB0_9THEO|nr:exodeoxyribonuclease VII large subunit [Thermoanaerobacter wiegelii]AEM78666.1 Exodeoxyribonuclease 7 large subunit [Thermoanaerobacter wiegelii Rt8.B1]
MQLKALNVSEITDYIKRMMDNDIILRNVRVRGEISNLKYHSTGIYFTLKDEVASLKCVMFNEYSRLLNFTLQDGMSVIATGRITVYEKSGTYQLYVQSIQSEGIGALYLAFNKLKEKLEKEGLFDSDKKEPIPKHPKKIAVVTSPTGAVIRDIITISRRRNPTVDILVVPVLVQGSSAADEICNALRILNKREDIDVIILARGGGSLEEIWPFNEEKVARCIYASRIPVVSAVGHETDFTISDFVADLRAPTPSAAAEIVVPDIKVYQRELFLLKTKLLTLMTAELNRKKKEFEGLNRALYLNSPTKKSEILRHKVENLTASLYNEMLSIYQHKRNDFLILAEKLNSLSPLKVLTRGYTIVLDKQEKVISSVKDIKPYDEIKILFKDGKAKAIVQEVKENE